MSGKSSLFSKLAARSPQPGCDSAIKKEMAKNMPALADEAVAPDIFRHRVAIQQYMRSHEALLPSLAEGEGVFGKLVSLANKIADIAMKEFTHSGNAITAKDKIVFRQICSQIVERHRRDNCLDKIEVENYGRRIGKLFLSIATQNDEDVVPYEQASPKASDSMSTVSAIGTLYADVAAFSFYLSPSKLLERVVAVVVHEANEATNKILPPGASAADRRSMNQTLTRILSTMMAGIYTRRAKAFCQSGENILSMSELGENEAEVDKILAEFSNSTKGYVAIALKYTPAT